MLKQQGPTHPCVKHALMSTNQPPATVKIAPLVNYHPPQAGHLPSSQLDVDPPQSDCFNGCLKLRKKTEEQTTNPAPDKQRKNLRNHQPYDWLTGKSEQCARVLTSMTTSSKLMTPGKLPSTTSSCPSSTSTSLPSKRSAFLRVAVSRRRLQVLLERTGVRRAPTILGMFFSAMPFDSLKTASSYTI